MQRHKKTPQLASRVHAGWWSISVYPRMIEGLPNKSQKTQLGKSQQWRNYQQLKLTATSNNGTGQLRLVKFLVAQNLLRSPIPRKTHYIIYIYIICVYLYIYIFSQSSTQEELQKQQNRDRILMYGPYAYVTDGRNSWIDQSGSERKLIENQRTGLLSTSSNKDHAWQMPSWCQLGEFLKFGWWLLLSSSPLVASVFLGMNKPNPVTRTIISVL